jgi:hypothetical protein
MHLVLGLSLGFAAVGQIPVQGVLVGADGSGLHGTHPMEIRFYVDDDAELADRVHAATESVSFADGAFAVSIAVDLSLFDGRPMWITTVVDGAESGPVAIGTVPYAGWAARAAGADDADQLGGFDASTYVRAIPSSAGAGLLLSGGGFALDAAWLDARYALTAGDGVVRSGLGLSADQAWLDARYALTASNGVVRSGLGLSADQAWLDARYALTASNGVVRSGLGLSADQAWLDARYAFTPGTGLVLSGRQFRADTTWLDANYLRSNGSVIDLGAGGQVRLGTGGKVIIGGVELDQAMLQRLRDLGTTVAQSQSDARASCAAIKSTNALQANGLYWIDPNGGSTSDAFQVYCDLSATDGPWTLVARVKAASGQAHWNVAAVGTPQFQGGATGKFSDATINVIRSNSTYGGSTQYKFTCFEDGSNATCTTQTMYCSRNCTFDSVNSVNSGPCALCSKSYEGPLTQLAPNTGTRGMGHHHQDATWFAWQRHPEQGTNPGCRSDACGSGDGHLWIK